MASAPSSPAAAIAVYVLAGGQGTRIRALLGEQTPKLLAPLAGRPFLDYLLRWLASMGFQRVHFGLGHLAEPIIARLQEQQQPLHCSWRVENSPLGTAGALRYALQQGDIAPEQTLLVLNGDSIAAVDLRQFILKHQQRAAVASLLSIPLADCRRFGRLEVDQEERIVRFCEKDPDDSQAGLINGGCYLFAPPMLQHIEQSAALSLERDIFMQPLPFALHGFSFAAPFIDFGTPESYQQAQSFFRHFFSFSS
ncbi:sugar phosphate nucleotidyltransferase [Candidatus Magnetaquicoccus inordinatus]|uniref:sugar phosphate nucleotidyltransferase n=1 Tax=Candidatus Magnetaquicoccus inordinatus TaxID=2496818 RepID=UPI00102B355D|nr:sugar phosphate nucleotidyltransferase [Candidatus Magnetaquicoccus inordinatus]